MKSLLASFLFLCLYASTSMREWAWGLSFAPRASRLHEGEQLSFLFLSSSNLLQISHQHLFYNFVVSNQRDSHPTLRKSFSIQPGVRDIFRILKTPPIEEDMIKTVRQAPDRISALICLGIFPGYYWSSVFFVSVGSIRCRYLKMRSSLLSNQVEGAFGSSRNNVLKFQSASFEECDQTRQIKSILIVWMHFLIIQLVLCLVDWGAWSNVGISQSLAVFSLIILILKISASWDAIIWKVWVLTCSQPKISCVDYWRISQIWSI